MKKFHFDSLFHMEADNMLYVNLSKVEFSSSLRKNYRSLTATPLTISQTVMTASALWVPSIDTLQHFNTFMLSLTASLDVCIVNNITASDDFSKVKNHKEAKKMYEWKRYEQWLRSNFQSSKHESKYKPFSITEMTMLAFYRSLDKSKLLLFPLLPRWSKYITNRYVCNYIFLFFSLMSLFWYFQMN